MTKEVRNSNIELLRVIAIFLIVMCHSTPWYGDTTLPSHINLGISQTNWHYCGLMIFRYAGFIGDAIFLTCSAYFLTDNDSVKSRRITDIISDTLFMSLASLALFIFLGGGYGHC